MGVEQFVAELKNLEALLDDNGLDPDPKRPDWTRFGAEVERVRTQAQALLERAQAAEVLAELSDEQRPALQRAAAQIAAEAAGVVWASGDRQNAGAILARARDLAPDGPARNELNAATREAEAFVLLTRARWMLRHEKFALGDKLAGQVSKLSTDAALRAGARGALDSPRPLKSAPALFRINGCGVALYGGRDHRQDGSYVSTYFISLLFVPVFPLTAYRVIDQGNNSYLFLAKERLGPIARVWRQGLLALAVLAIVWGSVSSWLHSPTRQARLALERGQAAEKKGAREDALAAYGEALSHYGVEAAKLRPAAEGVVRLTVAEVKEPFQPADVDQAARIVHRFEDLPVSPRRGSPARLLVSALERWSGQLGEASPEATEASLRVLELATGVAEETDGDEKARVEGKRNGVRRGLAEKLAGEWPLLALAQLAELGDDPAGLDASAKILATLVDEPSLLWEGRRPIRGLLNLVSAKDAELAARVTQGLQAAAALDADPARAALFEGADPRALAAWIKQHPKDQAVIVSLAEIQHANGDAAAAEALLRGLGAPGRTISRAQLLAASLRVDEGKLAEADGLLSRYLAGRLPAYQKVREAYDKATERLIDRVRTGNVPAALEARLNTTPNEDEQQRLIVEWMTAEVDKDPRLTELRGELAELADVVPAALLAGNVKLQLAGAASGAEKTRLLGEAEHAFLAIRQEAEDEPMFHLGLGQVYHRLGKADEGEQELLALLAKDDPETHLAVARAYRELGLMKRARDVSEDVYAHAAAPHKYAAAELRSLLALDQEESEAWLKKGDPKSLFVRRSLQEIEGHRHLRAGEWAQADRALAAVAAAYEAEAKHQSAASNNAALAYQGRYLATGDPAHLEKAVRLLESAIQLAPDNSIIISNLADVLVYRARVRVLDGFVKTKILKLDPSDADLIVSHLLAGPQREAVLAALRADPAMRRALELTKQEEVLAPQRTTPWAREKDWYETLRDGAALRGLAGRLKGVKLDRTQEDEAYHRVADASDDEKTLALLAEGKARVEAVVADAQKSGHAPTRAAALAVQSSWASRSHWLRDDPDGIARAVDATRQAMVAWPAIGAERTLASLLFAQAVMGARAAEPAVETALEDRRTIAPNLLLHRAATGADGGKITAALRRQPMLKEAVQLRAKAIAAGGAAWLDDWILARLAGDAELERLAGGVFAREDVTAGADLDLLLWGDRPAYVASLEVLRRGGK